VSTDSTDAQAFTLLAALLSNQCDQILDLIAKRRSAKRWEADIKRRAAQALEFYVNALALDPSSGAAASGLAWLLSEQYARLPIDTPSVAAAAERALEINSDEPVALFILAEKTGDDTLRQRAEALSPRIPQARWRPAREGGPVSPFGNGEPGRYDFFVIEVELLVNNQGETVTRFIVVSNVHQAHWVSNRAEHITKAMVYRYERGILAAKHRPAPASGKSLAQVIDEWPVPPALGVGGEPLPAGHPIRHDGMSLFYGVNGPWM
jgi:hypothetical protein